MSLTNWDGISASRDFVGLKNFIDFFNNKRGMGALIRTIRYAVFETALINIFGLLYALLLDEKLHGRTIVRTFIYIPSAIAALMMGYVWLLMLRGGGSSAIEQLMKAVGLGKYFSRWLTYPNTAMKTILFINVWQFSGTAMIIYLAGLQSIPTDLYESANIDGANSFQRFRNITLPLLIPSIKINVVTNIISGMTIHDSIIALTGGGPGNTTETMSVYIYRMSASSRSGYATAAALILLAAIAIPSVISYYLMQKKNVEMG